MKKIRKEGNLEEIFAVCPWCGCLFSFDITDIDEFSFSSELICPYCNLVVDKFFGGTRRELFNRLKDVRSKEK